jgi:hypothetical protein
MAESADFKEYTIKAGFFMGITDRSGSNINEKKSIVNYKKMCKNALLSRFPGARVMISHLHSRGRYAAPFCLVPLVLHKKRRLVPKLGEIAASICGTITSNKECWMVYNT